MKRIRLKHKNIEKTYLLYCFKQKIVLEKLYGRMYGIRVKMDFLTNRAGNLKIFLPL